jgi:hypothetical protein
MTHDVAAIEAAKDLCEPVSARVGAFRHLRLLGDDQSLFGDAEKEDPTAVMEFFYETGLASRICGSSRRRSGPHAPSPRKLAVNSVAELVS